MASISTVAMWFSSNGGRIEMLWLGWRVEMSLSFFILAFLITLFVAFILFRFFFGLIVMPFRVQKILKIKRIKKANLALEEGILASVYGDKQKILQGYTLSKKHLADTPLSLLMRLQGNTIKGNDAETFNTYKKMLKYTASRPIAIKGLISLSAKNDDKELFLNILNSARKNNVSLIYFISEAFNFSLKNNNWEILKEYASKEKIKNNKNMKNFLNILDFYLAKQDYEKGKFENAKNILKKSFASKVILPPAVDLYLKLNIKNKYRGLKILLKEYWKFFPHESILKFTLNNFNQLNILEKVKLLIEILDGHDNLYLKYLLLGEIKAKAKIWGDSKKDLLKSIEIFPNKKAYQTLISIEEETTYNKERIKAWLALARSCQEKLWECQSCLTLKHDWNIYCENCNNLFTFSHKGFNHKPNASGSEILSNRSFLKLA